MYADNLNYYGTISRFFHWSMALLFVAMFGTGIAIANKNYSVMGFHKSIGTILIILCAMRIFWAFKNRQNRPHGNFFVKAGHGLIYLLMFTIPLVAILRQYGSNRGALEVFGVKVMESAGYKIESLVNLGNQFHGELAWFLLVVLGGHVAMAIIHQLKGEKILNRIAGRRK